MKEEFAGEQKKKSFWLRFQTSVRRRLIAGLLVVVPLWLTYVALKFFFGLLDGFFGPLAIKWLGFHVPGLGFILLLAFVYIIGMVTTNVIGRAAVRFGEKLLDQIPLVRNIYQAAKQLIETISRSKSLLFKRVVLVEYPRVGLRTVGFVTNSVENPNTHERFEVVFIPTPPNPASGVSIIVPESQVIDPKMSLEEGIKMVISGGIVSPKQVTTSNEAVSQ